jgi:hypothetical protein
VSVIAAPFDGGDPTDAPGCEVDGWSALPAPRLRAVVDGLGTDGEWGPEAGASICDDDWEPAVEELQREHPSPLWSGCPPDLLVATNGEPLRRADDAVCTVTEVWHADLPDEAARTLPRCELADRADDACPDWDEGPDAVTNAPCWYFCDSASTSARCEPPAHAGAIDDPHRWQLRLCHDDACDPGIPAGRNALLHVACLTRPYVDGYPY